ncbi:hypothetical protein [Stenomitos frigidus]|nr:hypothetical protein [Stenomitos frigidus]
MQAGFAHVDATLIVGHDLSFVFKRQTAKICRGGIRGFEAIDLT